MTKIMNDNSVRKFFCKKNNSTDRNWITKPPKYTPKILNHNSPSLDTLAQLDTRNFDSLRKRARSKWFTNEIVLKLVDITSPLKKSYWNSYHCCNNLVQYGRNITSKYCNNRWCTTCNRIRTAKLLNAYGTQLKELKEPYFVTLTIPNVHASLLKCTIEQMKDKFSVLNKTIYKQFRRGTRVHKLKGIRKIECTYNAVFDTYHPHFHLIVDGYDIARDVIAEWLKHYPEAKRKAQDMTKANEGSMIELFKYTTKIVSKIKGNVTIIPKALDTIFRSMYGKRTFQVYGGLKAVIEDIEELDTQEYDGIEEYEFMEWVWSQDGTDWYSTTNGDGLTGFVPSENLKEIVK